MTAVRSLGATVFPGGPQGPAASRARRRIRAMLEPHGVDTDDAETAFGELFANAVTHTRSGAPGGIVGVSVFDVGGALRVEVIDQGSDHGCPVMREDADQCGRGLHIVAAYAAAWGWERRRRGGRLLTVVWFELPREKA
jgi:anti-sigma regulatory factor (Ser/Thr protein kinase)